MSDATERTCGECRHIRRGSNPEEVWCSKKCRIVPLDCDACDDDFWPRPSLVLQEAKQNVLDAIERYNDLDPEYPFDDRCISDEQLAKGPNGPVRWIGTPNTEQVEATLAEMAKDSPPTSIGGLVSDPGTPDLQEYREQWVDPEIQKLERNYASLRRVLDAAYNQASDGKGKVRHASGEPFEEQDICTEGRGLGLAFPIGQARKKAKEALRLLEIKGPDAAVADILGAINYLAAAVIVIEEIET